MGQLLSGVLWIGEANEDCQTMLEMETNIEKWIEQQRRQYLRVLPEKLDAIEGLLERWKHRPDAALLTDIIAILHRIHGVAGSYDLDEIGEVAGECEEQVGSALSDPESIVRGCLSRIRELMKTLERAD